MSGLGQQTVSTNSFSLPIPQLPTLPLSFCQWREAITGDSIVVNFVSDSARLGGPLPLRCASVFLLRHLRLLVQLVLRCPLRNSSQLNEESWFWSLATFQNTNLMQHVFESVPRAKLWDWADCRSTQMARTWFGETCLLLLITPASTCLQHSCKHVQALNEHPVDTRY